MALPVLQSTSRDDPDRHVLKDEHTFVITLSLVAHPMLLDGCARLRSTSTSAAADDLLLPATQCGKKLGIAHDDHFHDR